jgi:zinc transporter
MNAPLLNHCAGLVFGFVFDQGKGRPVTDDTLGAAVAGPHDFVWLHLALSDHRARRFLESFAPLPDEARALILAAEDRIQINLRPEGGFGVLPDIEQDFNDTSLDAGRLAFWLDERHLVTVRRHPVRGVEEVRHEVERGVALASPAALLARLGERYVEIVDMRLTALARELGRIEDAVLADRDGLDQMKLGPLRRELSRYTREFGSLRSALARAMSARRGVVESPLLEFLPHLLQDAEDFDRDAGALSDRARLLYEEVNTRIAAVTNRSLSALTVISTLLLPPTFVAGAFGMNVDGLPWAHDAHGFAVVLALCVILIAAGWLVLRRFRILP